jgi:hypothetical protein
MVMKYKRAAPWFEIEHVKIIIFNKIMKKVCENIFFRMSKRAIIAILTIIEFLRIVLTKFSFIFFFLLNTKSVDIKLSKFVLFDCVSKSSWCCKCKATYFLYIHISQHDKSSPAFFGLHLNDNMDKDALNAFPSSCRDTL